jgi:hypothetical protein
MNTGASNLRRTVILLVACFQVSVAVATERSPDIGVTDVLYASALDWQQSTAERKSALSAAFMRIFCTDIRMPAERLVACLDTDGKREPVFERAIACSAAIVRSDLSATSLPPCHRRSLPVGRAAEDRGGGVSQPSHPLDDVRQSGIVRSKKTAGCATAAEN